MKARVTQNLHLYHAPHNAIEGREFLVVSPPDENGHIRVETDEGYTFSLYPEEYELVEEEA